MSDRPLGIGQSMNPDPASTRTPYTQQWSLSAQHQFGNTASMEMVYVGSRSLGLTGQILENIAPIPGSSPLSSRLVYPNMPVGFVQNYTNVFKAWYNGASAKFEKRFSRGLIFQANYTWSKAIDYTDSMASLAGGAGTVTPSRWVASRLKGPAGFDVPHRLVFNYLYELPFKTGSRAANVIVANWAVSGITQIDNGIPYGVWVSQDWANTGTQGRMYQLPNVVGDPAIANPTPYQWFNRSAFALAERYGPTGNAGRNILRGDGMVNWDWALYKKWAFGEATNVEFRGDFFNLFNHPTFGLPDGRVDQASTYGKVSTTRVGGRSVQLGVRLHF